MTLIEIYARAGIARRFVLLPSKEYRNSFRSNSIPLGLEEVDRQVKERHSKTNND